jgi:hypothetical protein
LEAPAGAGATLRLQCEQKLERPQPQEKFHKRELAHMRRLVLRSAILVLMTANGMALRARAANLQVATATYPLPAGGRLSIKNVKGSIEVQGWDRNQVEVTVVKTAPAACACLDQVRVLAAPQTGGWSFVTVYTGSVKVPLRVDYLVRAPEELRLDRVSTLKGEIFINDIEGAARADTLEGDIQESGVSGQLEASSLNGDIKVALRRLTDPGGTLDLETVNGNVALVLPPRPNAELELSTVAGRIITPYALEASAAPGGTVKQKRLGRGGERLLLRTVRGNIRVEEQAEIL